MATKDSVNNFMIGAALKVGVLSNATANHTLFYYPEGTWCSLRGSFLCNTLMKGQQMNKSSKAYDYHMDLREGYILPMQNATEIKAKTSADLLN